MCTAAALLLGACDMLLELLSEEPETDKAVEWFWTFNYEKKTDYQIKAQRVYNGDKCVIYAENGSKVSSATARELGREYDTKIYNVMVEYFCEENFKAPTNSSITYKNTLDYANTYFGKNGKLTILLLDIKDGYQKVGDAFTAGYFWVGDFFESAEHSNKRSMVYLDTNPGMTFGSSTVYSTLVHELQHLINAAGRVGTNKSMDTWMDEGLSIMAEYLYLNYGNNTAIAKHPDNRIDWFNKDREGTIALGNNFYVWDNYQDIPNAILDEYSTVYLFFQWLYIQAGKDKKLLKEITANGSVTQSAGKIIPNGNDWETLIRTWMAANYLKNPNGEFGYKGDVALAQLVVRNINIQEIPSKFKARKTNGNKIILFPGEGVYSAINNSFSTSASGNIRYAGLKKGAQGSINITGPSFSGDTLLTYNKNTQGDAGENGDLTGLPGTPPSASVAGRSLADYNYPLIIDGRDLMRRYGRLEK